MFIHISRYQVCDDSMFIRDRINTTFDDEVIKCPSSISAFFHSICNAGIQVESFRLQETIHDDRFVESNTALSDGVELSRIN